MSQGCVDVTKGEEEREDGGPIGVPEGARARGRGRCVRLGTFPPSYEDTTTARSPRPREFGSVDPN